MSVEEPGENGGNVLGEERLAASETEKDAGEEVVVSRSDEDCYKKSVLIPVQMRRAAHAEQHATGQTRARRPGNSQC